MGQQEPEAVQGLSALEQQREPAAELPPQQEQEPELGGQGPQHLAQPVAEVHLQGEDSVAAVAAQGRRRWGLLRVERQDLLLEGERRGQLHRHLDRGVDSRLGRP